MTSSATDDFWRCLDAVPAAVRRVARQKYRLWLADPRHPSLHFKELAPGLWSVRITRGYRALGLREGEHVAWFWLGTHAEYDRLTG